MDIIAVARADRPSSAWSLAYITNINYYVYTMQYPIGKTLSQVPVFLKQCRFLKNFAQSRYNLCFFQCLSFHFGSKHPPELYLKQWFEFNNPNSVFSLDFLIKFKGISSKDFIRLEKCFNIAIKVYSKSAMGVVT